jgi:hypothetical protein
MGWCFYGRKMTAEQEMGEIAKLCTFDSGDGVSNALIDARKVGRAVYALVEARGKYAAGAAPFVQDADGAYRFLAVFLTASGGGDGWGYKAIDESSGPVESQCPHHLIKRASPIDPTILAADRAKKAEKEEAGGWFYSCAISAQDWRDRCTAPKPGASVAKMRVGDVIRLPEAVTFRGGIEVQEVKVSSYTRRGKQMRAYWCEEIGLCRIPAKLVAGAEIVSRAA